MSDKQTVLIITDGTQKVKKMAEDIVTVLKGKEITLKEASAFIGTDLLPAELLFFGCQEPNPPSFFNLEKMLQHINLAGRPLGIFSPNSENALQYLARIAKDSEAALNPVFLSEKNAVDIEKWVARVLVGK